MSNKNASIFYFIIFSTGEMNLVGSLRGVKRKNFIELFKSVGKIKKKNVVKRLLRPKTGFRENQFFFVFL